jgi:plastocyanin
MKRFGLILAALAMLLIPTSHAVAAANHVVKVADSDRDPQKWTWVPEQVTVKVGDTVTWDMTGAQVAHTATADDGSWDSGYINPNAKWTYKFTKVGDIPYHCTPHPWKKGVIHVTP